MQLSSRHSTPSGSPKLPPMAPVGAALLPLPESLEGRPGARAAPFRVPPPLCLDEIETAVPSEDDASSCALLRDAEPRDGGGAAAASNGERGAHLLTCRGAHIRRTVSLTQFRPARREGEPPPEGGRGPRTAVADGIARSVSLQVQRAAAEEEAAKGGPGGDNVPAGLFKGPCCCCQGKDVAALLPCGCHGIRCGRQVLQPGRTVPSPGGKWPAAPPPGPAPLDSHSGWRQRRLSSGRRGAQSLPPSPDGGSAGGKSSFVDVPPRSASSCPPTPAGPPLGSL